MICPGCAFDNPQGIKFCGGCGSPLPNLCSECGFENPHGFNFCGNCGTRMVEDISLHGTRSSGLPSASVSIGPERRRLTVMFCDMVGSTALSHRLDPEDLRVVVQNYQDVCEKEVSKYDGHTAQYLGDGILVYFGYPKAHENDAHRAVSSGLGILNAITDLNKQLQNTIGTSISIRIGIHTGLVVIGNIGEKEASQHLALGAAPNIAAKLEGLAPPNSMVISADTYELVQQHFRCTDLGKKKIKGVEDDLSVYQVISDLGALKRFEYQPSANTVPMMGRDEEVKRLLDYWEEAKVGNSHIVMVSAEAGVGKSRVIQTMVEQVAHEENLWVVPHQCSPYHGKTAFHPIAQTMKRLGLKLKGDENPHEQLELLEQFLAYFGLPLQELVPLFAGILTLSLEDSNYKTPQFSVEQQKAKIINALLSIFMKRAKEKNLLLIFEDLHWMDDASLEVIDQLINQSPSMNLLTILSFRPQFEPTWRLRPHLIMMPLSNLPEQAVKDIVHRIANHKKLPENLVQEIIKKTDGVPLFVEELTKMVLNSDMVIEQDDCFELSGPVSSLAIPNTLHDSLLARLDTMNTARRIAQLGSVIGREFKYALARDVSDMNEGQLRDCLEQLVRAELLIQSGAPPEAIFTFRHALIRDAAYQSLLKSQQQTLHKKVAFILVEKYPEQAQDQPAELAYHFEKGNEWEQAILQWTVAGSKARQYQAFDEAIGYLQRALDLLPKLENKENREVMELKVLATQAPIFLMTAGWGSKLTFKASSRLEQLAEKQGDKIRLFRALRISTIYELFTGIPIKALNKAKKALAIAEDLDNIEFKMEAHRLIGQTSIFNGLLVQSKESFESAISLNQDSNQLLSTEFSSGDPVTISIAQSGHVLWALGFPDQSIKRLEQALYQSEKNGLPYDQCICLFIGSMVNYWCGNTALSFDLASKCLDLGKEFGINFFGQEATTFMGANKVVKGDVKEGLAMMQTAITNRPQIARQGYQLHVATFAETCLAHGAYDKGLEAIESAFELFDQTNDQMMRSELYRIKGDLLFKKDCNSYSEIIEQSYQSSLKIARAQSAKSLELRTIMSIATLRKRENKASEGLNLISNIYSWFTEGFNTKDLLKAKSMINEMALSTS